MANTKILILVLIAISLLSCNARSISKEEHLKMKRELKRLNKPAVENIQVGEWFGTRATMNVWNPLVSDNRQFSLAQLWIINDPIDQLNTIEAGWNVYPQLHGGGLPRLFVFWTSDSYKTTGYYNLLCPGFVQVNKDIALGSLMRTSVYNGDQQEATLAIFKEKSTGNWWLTFGDDHVQVGYWPKSLFTSLADKSTGTEWGGETTTPGGIKSPPMGSGRFPDEGFKKASYMRRLQYVDNTNTFTDIPNGGFIYSDVQCYKLIDGGNLGGDWGRIFYFGGPGGC